MTLLERLRHYYKTNGINENWIGPKYGERHLKLFPLHILPKAFRNWMKIHDAHHLITGFETTFRGEVEIAAWVLARNGLNFGSKPRCPLFSYWGYLILGFNRTFFMPKTVLRAFNKGKNEYSLHSLNPDQVLQMEFGSQPLRRNRIFL